MAAKKQKLKPDTILKNYWANNEQFADLFNAVLFKGKQMIKPEELEDVDTEESSILEHKDYAESLSASRDNIKIQKRSTEYGIELVLLGLESQQHIHYAMPMRVMGYDYGAYKKQYESNAAKYKTSEGLTEDELSRMKRTDKLIPTITVVIYYGEDEWDGATSLHEMLNIPPEIKDYVNDYKMRLIEARKNDLVFHNINNQDLFNLLKILLNKKDGAAAAKRAAVEYTNTHTVDKAVVMTAAGATNCKIDYDAMAKKGEVDMCTVFEVERAEGMAEGIAKGKAEGRAEEIIKTGFEFNMETKEIINRLQTKLDISSEKAWEYFNIFKE